MDTTTFPDSMTPEQDIDSRDLANLTRQQAKELLEAMRRAVSEVPSYVEVQGMKYWLANRLDIDI